MGWFSKIKKAVSATVQAVTNTVNVVRTVAANALEWMAEKGKQFIGKAKEVYQKIKPHLTKLANTLIVVGGVLLVASFILASFGTTSAFIAGLGGLLLSIGKDTKSLMHLEDSPILHYLEKSLVFTFDGMKTSANFIRPKEQLIEAKQHQITYQKTLILLENTLQEQPNQELDDYKYKIELANMLNNYSIAKTLLQEALENDIDDFQQYLKLRAVQKILQEADAKITAMENQEQFDKRDMFLINIAETLISNADLSENDAIYLDEVIQERFGHSLIPFVFEELILIWVKKQTELERLFHEMNIKVAGKKTALKRLEMHRKISTLTTDEQKSLNELQEILPQIEKERIVLDNQRRSMGRYVFAAEGFMQFLEKDLEVLEQENKYFSTEDIEEIAGTIMRIAQQNLAWEQLTADEQSLIIDYSNIFAKDGRKRAKELADKIQLEI